ncbi:hypothetical protein LV779_09100 [Streptomyces thinghirensis]|nr:hypothetical protein [Streptomyces thinghirensis]
MANFGGTRHRGAAPSRGRSRLQYIDRPIQQADDCSTAAARTYALQRLGGAPHPRRTRPAGGDERADPQPEVPAGEPG